MLFFLLACSTAVVKDSSDAGLTDDGPPDQPGPWAAGTMLSYVTGSTGLSVPVQVWYPTTTTEGTPYTYDEVYTGTALAGPVADCSARRPVMMFSHGSGGIRWQSLFLTEFLATHGWIVVAPDHLTNTFFDDTGPLIELALRRPVDIQDAYNWLLDTEAGGLLSNCIDADAGYVMAGHSFGGYTSIAIGGANIDVAASLSYCAANDDWLCPDVEAWAVDNPDTTSITLADPRARAIIPMTPAGYEILVGGLPDVAVPALFWGGGLDTLTPVETQVRPLYEDVSSAPAYFGVLPEAGHFTFSDACAFLPTFEDCSDPYMVPEDAHAIVRATTLAFLRTLDGGSGDGWLPPNDSRLEWEERVSPP